MMMSGSPRDGRQHKGCRRCGPKSTLVYREQDKAWVCLQGGCRFGVEKTINQVESRSGYHHQ